MTLKAPQTRDGAEEACLAHNQEVAGSKPASANNFFNSGGCSSGVERIVCIDEARGSIPLISKIDIKTFTKFLIMKRSTLKIVPVDSDDSMYNTSPTPSPFFQIMREPGRHQFLHPGSPVGSPVGSPYGSPVGSPVASSVASSSSDDQYDRNRKCQDECGKIGCFAALCGALACLLTL
jgi:hypothetical protein